MKAIDKLRLGKATPPVATPCVWIKWLDDGMPDHRTAYWGPLNGWVDDRGNELDAPDEWVEQ